MPHSIHHITLSVGDLATSSAWYLALLGAPQATYPDSGPGFDRVALAWDGLTLVLRQDHGTPEGDRFSPHRIGLDHLSLACESEAEVIAYAARMDALGIERGPVEDAAYAWVVTGRDPDGIALEFYCAKG